MMIFDLLLFDLFLIYFRVFRDSSFSGNCCRASAFDGENTQSIASEQATQRYCVCSRGAMVTSQTAGS